MLAGRRHLGSREKRFHGGLRAYWRKEHVVGSMRGAVANLEDYAGSFVHRRNPTDRASATLKWPGDHRAAKSGEMFDWSLGSIQVGVFNNSVFHAKEGERWRQVILDRNGSALISQISSDRYLLTNPSDIELRGDLVPPSSLPGFRMSLDSLMSWSVGVKSVKVYDIFVTDRRYNANEYPNSPVGAMRIVAEYDVDSSALARKVAQVRDATTQWMSELGDFKTKCARAREDNDIVVIGSNRTRSSDPPPSPAGR